MSSKIPTAVTLADIDLESIVRSVLQRLQGTPVVSTSNSPNCHSLNQRMITLEDLEGLPASTTQLQLPEKCVVTPAVKDELKQRKISFVRGAIQSTGYTPAIPSNAQPKPKSPFRRVRLIHDDSVDTGLHAAVKRQLISRNVRICDEAGVTAMLSNRPSIAVYESISASTSAVLISRVDDVQRFKNELRPTVFVLDIQHLPLIALINSIVAIVKRSDATWTGVPKITVAGGQR
ncbi:hypothetical protein [Neorhodopirellula lusitana]|uniref:hypothetical protein n=1 Tax=Neorhodopirellula lusitana TaxID=445327 RepID=UPI00384D2739